MILLDTSVLIDYFRSKDAELLRRMRDLEAAICGVTRAEILCGTRDEQHRGRLIDALDVFHQISIPESLWDDIGDTLATLRRSGVTVPFTDVVIATVATASGLQLWTRDKQFSLIQYLVPELQLFDEHQGV
jgi:predicted nucleic acid-binding protein